MMDGLFKKYTCSNIVSLAAVFSLVTQRSGALRDETKSGCEEHQQSHAGLVGHVAVEITK